MATTVIMPRQGNSVESCLITAWKKHQGDQVAEGDVLCEAETDKALIEIESPTSGTLLAMFFQEGDDVPVLTNIAVIGLPGEDVEPFRPVVTENQTDEKASDSSAGQTQAKKPEPALKISAVGSTSPPRDNTFSAISPRAQHLAARENVDIGQLQGTGPGGRIIERDVEAALSNRPKMSPLARRMAAQGDFSLPTRGSGVSGRVMAHDLATTPAETDSSPHPGDEVEAIPVKGIRKVIADRTLQSLQNSAQLTLNATADARAILAYRERLKQSAGPLELPDISLNDLILFAVARTLPRFPNLNTLLSEDTVWQYKNVHLGFAVDTPRGLVVPVVRNAQTMSLKQLSQEIGRLNKACLAGTIQPDDLQGGTFTVTNLGTLGIDTFTPILNHPQVGILGVGGITLKPVPGEGEVTFQPHLNLSLTIDHRAVDGAPGARFLQALSQGLAEFELLLAL